VAPDRIVEPLAELLEHASLVRESGIGREVELPVALDPHGSVLGHELRSGLELLRRAEDGRRRRDVRQGEVVVQGLTVDLAVDPGREQALQLGPEEEAAPVVGPVERLDAEPIASDEESAAGRVPDGEREHAAELLGTARAELLVEMDDRFGVRVGAEAVPAGFEVPPQLLEVVDLAVLDDGDGAVLVEHGLMTARHVDDREAAHAHREGAVDQEALVVRSAVHHDVAHRLEHMPRRRRARIF